MVTPLKTDCEQEIGESISGAVRQIVKSQQALTSPDAAPMALLV